MNQNPYFLTYLGSGLSSWLLLSSFQRSSLIGVSYEQTTNWAGFIFFRAFFIISLLFIHPAEDAVILYEYSNTLANTGVISYGNIGTPIEGATDFLWMVAISLFHFVGINEYTASLMITSLSLYLLIKLLCKHNHLFFHSHRNDYYVIYLFCSIWV